MSNPYRVVEVRCIECSAVIRTYDVTGEGVAQVESVYYDDEMCKPCATEYNRLIDGAVPGQV